MSVEIPLTHGYVAIVDDEDADLAELKWHATVSPSLNVYARRSLNTKPQRVLLLHRVVIERALGRSLVDGEFVDHIDGNGLSNLRANLRVATRSENNRNSRTPRTNTSGFKGVTFHKGHRKWHASITVSGRRKHLGYFNSPHEAHQVYVAAAKELYGEFAHSGIQPLAAISKIKGA